jgi:hypothetical protein
MPVLARAGVSYELRIEAVDAGNVGPVSAVPPPPPVTRNYFVDHGQLRAEAPSGSLGYQFKDRTMFVIDARQRIVHVLKSATTADFLARYATAVKQLDAAAAAASPEDRADAQRRADGMRAVEQRLTQTVPRDFRVTVRFESVEGHACRIWEERELGVKRLEFCVAPVAGVPGGAEILGGLETLSRFREGAQFAFGVDLGVAPWWPDITALGGLPLLIRVFDVDSVTSQIEVHAIKAAVAVDDRFALPAGYSVQDGPEFITWCCPT